MNGKNCIVDSAVANVDSAAGYFRDYDLIPNTNLPIRLRLQKDTVNLLLRMNHSEHFLKGIPKHCTNIDKTT